MNTKAKLSFLIDELHAFGTCEAMSMISYRHEASWESVNLARGSGRGWVSLKEYPASGAKEVPEKGAMGRNGAICRTVPGEPRGL
jgi:hypothetical protein